MLEPDDSVAAIETILAAGWKEYPVFEILDKNDRSFFKKFPSDKINKGERIQHSIGLRMWDYRKYGQKFIGWDIVGQIKGCKITISTKIETLDNNVLDLIQLLNVYGENHLEYTVADAT